MMRENYIQGGSWPSKGARVRLIYPVLFMLLVTLPLQMESSRNKQSQVMNNIVHVYVSEDLRQGHILQTQTGLKFMIILFSHSPSPGIIDLNHHDQHE